MPTLGQLEDVEAVLGRDLTGSEFLRVDRLLEMSEREVKRWTGQHFARATTTDTLKVRNGTVRLPQRPVNAVSAVTDTNGNAIAFTWVKGDVLRTGTNVLDCFGWEPWASGLDYVVVTYDHGYDEIPADVSMVVAEMAAAALSAPADGLRQATVDDVTIVRESSGGGAIRMTVQHRITLDDYRRPASSASVTLRY
jgi:hypothetical protein